MKTKLTFKQSILAGLSAGLAAAVINALLFFIFQAAGILTDTIYVQPNTPLTLIPVLISSIIPLLIGSCIFFLLEKFTTNGFRIFSIISIIFLLISFSSPFMQIPGVTLSYAIVLNLMHVVATVSILYFINRAIIAKN